jgi:hypothetical protein
VLARIYDLSLPANESQKSLLHFDHLDFFHSAAEKKAQQEYFSHLIMRLLVEIVPCFQNVFGRAVDPHIPHRFSESTGKKSVMVPLPIVYEDEKDKEGMLTYLRKLKEWTASLVGEGLRARLFTLFGDQLTVAMVRNTQGFVADVDDPLDWFSLFVSLPGDFHARMNSHDVCYPVFFSFFPPCPCSTIYHLFFLS